MGRTLLSYATLTSHIPTSKSHKLGRTSTLSHHNHNLDTTTMPPRPFKRPRTSRDDILALQNNTFSPARGDFYSPNIPFTPKTPAHIKLPRTGKIYGSTKNAPSLPEGYTRVVAGTPVSFNKELVEPSPSGPWQSPPPPSSESGSEDFPWCPGPTQPQAPSLGSEDFPWRPGQPQPQAPPLGSENYVMWREPRQQPSSSESGPEHRVYWPGQPPQPPSSLGPAHCVWGRGQPPQPPSSPIPEQHVSPQEPPQQPPPPLSPGSEYLATGRWPRRSSHRVSWPARAPQSPFSSPGSGSEPVSSGPGPRRSRSFSSGSEPLPSGSWPPPLPSFTSGSEEDLVDRTGWQGPVRPPSPLSSTPSSPDGVGNPFRVLKGLTPTRVFKVPSTTTASSTVEEEASPDYQAIDDQTVDDQTIDDEFPEEAATSDDESTEAETPADEQSNYIPSDEEYQPSPSAEPPISPSTSTSTSTSSTATTPSTTSSSQSFASTYGPITTLTDPMRGLLRSVAETINYVAKLQNTRVDAFDAASVRGATGVLPREPWDSAPDRALASAAAILAKLVAMPVGEFALLARRCLALREELAQGGVLFD
ncbi:hypothetical protein F5B20DRAFT_597719 [Whalleya microplaca]|nr:hypothetical protein F5B20DRAFT_597719 [Whalleya microplaca]